jgi:hypothetical protein
VQEGSGLDLGDEPVQVGRVTDQLSRRDGHRRACAEVHAGEPALRADGSLIGPRQGMGGELVTVHLDRCVDRLMSRSTGRFTVSRTVAHGMSRINSVVSRGRSIVDRSMSRLTGHESRV